MRRFVLAIVAFVIWAACFCVFPPQSAAQTGTIRRSQNAIPGSYIVIVKRENPTQFQTDPSVEPEAFQLSDRYGATVDKVYTTAIKGFSAKMSEAQAVQMSLDPRVLAVEEVWVFPRRWSPCPGIVLHYRRTPVVSIRADINCSNGLGKRADFYSKSISGRSCLGNKSGSRERPLTRLMTSRSP